MAADKNHNIKHKRKIIKRNTAIVRSQIALWAVWLICTVLKETNLAISFTVLTGCCYTVLFLMVILELSSGYRYNKRELAALLIAIPLLWMQGLNLGNTGFAQLFTLIFVFRKIDMTEIAKVSLLVLGLTIVTIAALSVIGVIPDTYIQQADGYYARQERGSFGFAWPSRIQTYVLIMLCLYMVYSRERIKVISIVFFCALSLSIGLITDARLPMYLTFLLAALCLLLKIMPNFSLKKGKVRRIGLSASFILAAAVSILLPMAYSFDPIRFVDLNHLLTGRLYLSAIAMDTRDLTLFGSALSASQGSADNYTALYGYFDCGYLNFLYSYGIVPSLFFVVMLSIAAWQITINNDKYCGIGLLMMAVLSMFYSHVFMNPSYGLLLFLAGSVFDFPKSDAVVSRKKHYVAKNERGVTYG